jgi:hypothetical protein
VIVTFSAAELNARRGVQTGRGIGVDCFEFVA